MIYFCFQHVFVRLLHGLEMTTRVLKSFSVKYPTSKKCCKTQIETTFFIFSLSSVCCSALDLAISPASVKNGSLSLKMGP